MKRNYIYLCLLFVNSFIVASYGQESKIKSGDKQYEQYAFIDAVKTYERVANKGYKSEDMFKKLGNAYYFNSNFEGATKWYGELFAMNKEQESEYTYRYAQSLKSIGQEANANEILEEFMSKNEKDSRVKLLKKDKNYLGQIKNNTGRYQIQNAGINTKYSDYGSFVSNNSLYFASARGIGVANQRVHNWTGEHFTNLYRVNLNSVGQTTTSTSEVEKFNKNINSKFHESSPVFTKDGKTVYFTRNNYLEGNKGTDLKKITLLKIYKATLENDQWSNVTELPFDSDEYSTAHPALSPDEKTLFFVSDMPGTLGQSDIFKVEIRANGSYGPVVNLGDGINTEGRESFPYVTNENEIYFASDGHPGIGGFDVFVGKLKPEGGVGGVQNIGADVNSPMDDFAYIIDTESRKGFFSSNKEGGKGSDDIYSFLETKKISCEQELSGLITDAQTGKSLPGGKISLFDANLNLKSSSIADGDGRYHFVSECGEAYVVRAEKEGYSTNEQRVTIAFEKGKTDLSIALEATNSKVAVGDDLGKSFGIKTIYFDLNKSKIRKEAAFDLEKILDVLKDHPTMKLDIRSHTDSRASSKYNEDLSEKRAQSTIAWLVKNGVAQSRLTGKGYGETQLVNPCADGVDCTEEEHQANRRSQFIITTL